MTIELTDEEFSGLLLMGGYAAGAAMRHGDQQMMGNFLDLMNRLNRNNPNWKNYEIPPEKTP